METRAAWRESSGRGACSSAIAGRAGLRPLLVLPSFSRREAGATSCLCWASLRAEPRASFISAATPPFLPSCIIHQTNLFFQTTPTQTTTPNPIPLPQQQPPQCLSPDRKSHTHHTASRLFARREGGANRSTNNTTVPQANTPLQRHHQDHLRRRAPSSRCLP